MSDHPYLYSRAMDKVSCLSEASSEVEEVLEKVIMELEEEKKDKLEAYLELLTEDMAQNERRAYIGGLKDGIWVEREIGRIGKD